MRKWKSQFSESVDKWAKESAGATHKGIKLNKVPKTDEKGADEVVTEEIYHSTRQMVDQRDYESR